MIVRPPDISLPTKLGRPVQNSPTKASLARDRTSGCAEFEALFVGQFPRLVRGLSLILGDVETAADVAQDAFVQAYRHWERVGSYEDRAAWLWRAALNRGVERASTAASSSRGGAVPVSTARYGRPRSGADLARQVASLPVCKRTVVSLFCVADISVEEIAALLGVAEGTAESQLHDGRTRLRAALEAKEERMDDEHLRSRLSQLAPSVDTAAGWEALQARLAELERRRWLLPLDEALEEE